jgi:serine/threonine-protein kinase HipA
MVTTAYVKVWGQVVGAVAWDEALGIGRFEYAPVAAQRGWDLAPLKMPVRQGGKVHSFPALRPRTDAVGDTFHGLPGLLADALPDRFGNRLLDAWLARNGRPAGTLNPVERLCFVGTRGMGALEFEPTWKRESGEAFGVEVAGLVDLAHHLLSSRAGFSSRLHSEADVAQLVQIGTSAGGARPKAVVAFNPETGEIRSGQTVAPPGFVHHLIKFDGFHDDEIGPSSGYGRVEMAYADMARTCGIDMMPCRLLEENGRAHFMTQRFDREGERRKHHLATWCGLEHFDYNDVLSYSYEQLFNTLRALRLPYAAADQVFRRMVFNVVARNCDDHTKNTSFLLKEGGEWELAPAYDVCFAYREGSPWVSQHALCIQGKRRGISRADVLAVAKAVGIKRAQGIIELIESTLMRWPEFAEEHKVPPALRDSIRSHLAPLP